MSPPDRANTDARAEAGRPQRADGRRNQARVLEEAFAAFAAHGASVSIREIARRAGVSTGTVTRHYPTKESLFRAVALHRIEHLDLIRGKGRGAFERAWLSSNYGPKDIGRCGWRSRQGEPHPKHFRFLCRKAP